MKKPIDRDEQFFRAKFQDPPDVNPKDFRRSLRQERKVWKRELTRHQRRRSKSELKHIGE